MKRSMAITTVLVLALSSFFVVRRFRRGRAEAAPAAAAAPGAIRAPVAQPGVSEPADAPSPAAPSAIAAAPGLGGHAGRASWAA